MPDLKGPDCITLRVRELETSRHCHRDVIGLKPSPESRPNLVRWLRFVSQTVIQSQFMMAVER